MRLVIVSILLLLLSLSCRKGKVLPGPIYVEYHDVTKACVSPQGAFGQFDPYAIYEAPQYPEYVDTSDAQSYANNFNTTLKTALEKNNVYLSETPSDYKLQVTSLCVNESRHRQSYYDSCSSNTNYVYFSDLEAVVYASLFKNGVLIDSWNRHTASHESVRSKLDSCGEPKVRRVLCGINCLLDRLAKELRAKVSTAIYTNEGF